MSRNLDLIKRDIENTFNMGALRLSAEKMAEFVVASNNTSPLTLVYAGKNGRMILDDKIHGNLSSLIGFKIGCDADDPEVSIIILFDTIKTKDLEAMGCQRSISVGRLRKFAMQNIHPAAKVLNKQVATMLWNSAADFYTLKYMLSKKGVEIPGIMILPSCEENDPDNSTVVRWNFPREKWEYENEHLVECGIDYDTPFWCYCKLI